jgi:hypothetical protein
MTLRQIIATTFSLLTAHTLTAIFAVRLRYAKSKRGLATDSTGKIIESPFDTGFLTQSTSVTIAATHAGKTLVHNGAGAITYTLPKNTVDPLPIGTQFEVLQQNTGVPTVAPVDGDVTILLQSGKAAAPLARYTKIKLEKISANQWVATGTLATA